MAERVIVFLRNCGAIWKRFRALAKATTETTLDGEERSLAANAALERLMRRAVAEDRVPVPGEVPVPEWIGVPPWLPSRPWDEPRTRENAKPINVKGITPVIRDRFKALCARRGRSMQDALAMMMVLAIEGGGVPREAGE